MGLEKTTPPCWLSHSKLITDLKWALDATWQSHCVSTVPSFPPLFRQLLHTFYLLFKHPWSPYSWLFTFSPKIPEIISRDATSTPTTCLRLCPCSHLLGHDVLSPSTRTFSRTLLHEIFPLFPMSSIFFFLPNSQWHMSYYFSYYIKTSSLDSDFSSSYWPVSFLAFTAERLHESSRSIPSSSQLSLHLNSSYSTGVVLFGATGGISLLKPMVRTHSLLTSFASNI